ncbi:hypothetical protein AURDEDRAFT_39099, partial [Auricularia subglabra TFB-10046 SS5]
PPPRNVPLYDPARPTHEPVIRMPKKREHLDGFSSSAISVLSCRGRVGSLDDKPLTLRLDSGASLSLIKRAYLDSLLHPPKIRKGMKVQIVQLTSTTPHLEGYVKLPVFIRSEDGTTLEFEIEAYVVPDMTVELLLGEDWHHNYELGVLRNVVEGTRVKVGKTGYYFKATSLAADTAAAEVQAFNVRSFKVLHASAAGFIKAKSHRRARAARYRRTRSTSNGELRAYRDTIVRPNSTALVDLDSSLPLGREWFVERNLVCVGHDAFLSVPNSFISTSTEPL